MFPTVLLGLMCAFSTVTTAAARTDTAQCTQCYTECSAAAAADPDNTAGGRGGECYSTHFKNSLRKQGNNIVEDIRKITEEKHEEIISKLAKLIKQKIVGEVGEVGEDVAKHVINDVKQHEEQHEEQLKQLNTKLESIRNRDEERLELLVGLAKVVAEINETLDETLKLDEDEVSLDEVSQILSQIQILSRLKKESLKEKEIDEEIGAELAKLETLVESAIDAFKNPVSWIVLILLLCGSTLAGVNFSMNVFSSFLRSE